MSTHEIYLSTKKCVFLLWILLYCLTLHDNLTLIKIIYLFSTIYII